MVDPLLQGRGNSSSIVEFVNRSSSRRLVINRHARVDSETTDIRSQSSEPNISAVNSFPIFFYILLDVIDRAGARSESANAFT